MATPIIMPRQGQSVESCLIGKWHKQVGDAVAEGVGSSKVAGVVLLGALSAYLPFDVATWEAAIGRNVPPGWLDMNLAAFAAGRKVGG